MLIVATLTLITTARHWLSNLEPLVFIWPTRSLSTRWDSILLHAHGLVVMAKDEIPPCPMLAVRGGEDFHLNQGSGMP